MVAVNLKNMDVEALLALRACGENARRAEPRLAAAIGAARQRGRQEARPPKTGRRGAMKGVKVPPKYRGPGGRDMGRAGRDSTLVGSLAEGGTFNRGVFDRRES
jgi:hypothetical protein